MRNKTTAFLLTERHHPFAYCSISLFCSTEGVIMCLEGLGKPFTTAPFYRRFLRSMFKPIRYIFSSLHLWKRLWCSHKFLHSLSKLTDGDPLWESVLFTQYSGHIFQMEHLNLVNSRLTDCDLRRISAEHLTVYEKSELTLEGLRQLLLVGGFLQENDQSAP